MNVCSRVTGVGIEMTPGIFRKTVMMTVQNGLQTILMRIYLEIKSNLSWYLREQG